MRLRRLVVATLVAAGCYNPTIPDGVQMCSADLHCASGYDCGPDHRCYRAGHVPTPPDVAFIVDLAAPLDMAQCTQAGCGGATPICDPDSGQCVPCLIDSQCPAGALCHDKQCLPGCSATHGCADGGGLCDVDAGMCHACTGDNDCGDPMNPRCDLATGLCAACLPANDNCPAGQYCAQTNGTWQCAQGCKMDDDCNAPRGAGDGGAGDGGDGGGASDGGADDGGAPRRALSCCAHVCVDVTGDAANCGTCGAACGNGQSCCASACVDPASDVTNCGRCGNACAGSNATWACTNGACTVAGCMASFKDCNTDPKDGCEADLQSDPANCMACGNACVVPNSQASCSGGMCGLGRCNPGFADCDGNLANGCETNVATDVANCGGCGHGCGQVANGAAACTMGQCSVGSCNQGYADCDQQPANGCEIALTADPNNCRACGNVCPSVANGAPACSAGVCGVGSCAAGYQDCNHNAGDGCEASLNVDPVNCGGCGLVCAPVTNGTPGCSGGKCGIAGCKPGFADCNGQANDGCEVNTGSDPNNCNACGSKCVVVANGSATCVGGACGTTCNASYTLCGGACVNLTNDKNNCGGCGKVCPVACSNGSCVNVVPFSNWNGISWYKVQVIGFMTDDNVYAACKAVGLNVPCQTSGSCMYNDNLCKPQTPENNCNNPMYGLAQGLCGTTPNGCAPLNGVYQYMGHHWSGACGVYQGSWCDTGANRSNQFALCIQ